MTPSAPLVRSCLAPAARPSADRLPLVLLFGVVAVVAGGCSEGSPTVGERGRNVYLAQCIACHAPDPAQAGPLGPAVKGSSRALIEAKVLRGTYPPGHTPKRPTSLMVPQPALADDVPALAEFLK